MPSEAHNHDATSTRLGTLQSMPIIVTTTHAVTYSLSRDDSGYHHYYRQVAQLSQRERAARWVRLGQKWKTGTGDNILRTL